MRASEAGLLILFTFAVIFPTVKAKSQDFDDEVWEKRAEEAKKTAREAYDPNPEEVTERFNLDVHIALENEKSARRALEGAEGTKKKPKKRDDECLAVNPIDRCWRCDQNWANNRKKLADCALGFGRRTTGGKAGDFYVVTSNADDDLVNPKPGTLRHAVIQDRPLWITFAHDMVIRLTQELIVNDNKTIDGRGAHILIKNGAQITIQYVKNIIISNIHIRGSKVGNGGMIRDSGHHYGRRSTSDGDGISIFGASHIWIDHVSISDCQDGLIDAVMGSTAITISNCHFTDHNDVMLFGASDKHSEDSVMQVTVAFNHFGQGLVQRMPRCRWGFVHVVNNDYTHWLMYAIGGSKHPTILSQGNRFIAPPNTNAKQVTKREYSPESEWKSWSWRSENDLMMNGAFFVQSGPPIKNLDKRDVITSKPGTYVTRLTRFAGPLGCRVNKPC